MDTSTDSGRTGRRPGNSGTRDAILAAARTRFADAGFDRATIRSIAADAGVDAALVHHYFGTKRDLFMAVVEVPIDPTELLEVMNVSPLDELGATIIRNVVAAWDSPAGEGMKAAVRGTLAGARDPALMRTFLLNIALKDVRRRLDAQVGDADMRVSLAASQVIGLFVARKLLHIEPVASMTLEQLEVTIAPTLQRYFTGDLAEPTG